MNVDSCKMNLKLFGIILILGVLSIQCASGNVSQDVAEIKPNENITSTSTTQETIVKEITPSEDKTKDKRQIGLRDTQVYPNHRTEIDVHENPEENVYGSNQNQFILRPIVAQALHGQDDRPRNSVHLRQYPATIRAHGAQLMEQSPEIQHFEYLQGISRNYPKNAQITQRPKNIAATAATVRKPSLLPAEQYNIIEDNEEQNAAAISAPLQQRQQHPQQRQQYQVIPEEQFLKLLEQELQARAYHEARLQQHQQAVHMQTVATTAPKRLGSSQNDRRSDGLGNYRQAAPESGGSAGSDATLYVQQQYGGPKYLPLVHIQQQAQPQPTAEPQVTEPDAESPIPPQIAYFRQPKINYRTNPNHPLAKSSLESEIEKLLEANRQSLDENANVHGNQQELAYLQQRPQSKAIFSSSTARSTLVDANNNAFVPSLFQFKQFPTPQSIYPVQNSRKLGPVVYPTQAQPQQQPQQQSQSQSQSQPTVDYSQYYQQDVKPSSIPKTKNYRHKHYDAKLLTSASQKTKKKNTSPPPQTLSYDYDNQEQSNDPNVFHPSPPDPSTQHAAPTQSSNPVTPANFHQFLIPSSAPSQSSIFVSQGTGIVSRSYSSTTHKPKTVEDLKQLNLPQPGGKPLTQAQFQALIDAGYPVTAVPVPIPVPYEQYIKDHPEYQNQAPAEYRTRSSQFAPQHTSPIRRPTHQRYTAAASEPSVRIISSPTAAEADENGNAQYSRYIVSNQKRRTRNEKDEEVAGKKNKN